MAAIPAVVPNPSRVSFPTSLLIRRTSTHWLREPAVLCREGDEHPDHDDVVDDGREGRGDEASMGIEDRARQRREPVEEHLRQEPEGEDRHHVQLRDAFGSCRVHRVEPCDEGREQHRDRRQHREHGHGDGEQRRGRTGVAVLEVFHEERHERGGEHAAEDQLVDDVRGRVRQVVRVGQAGAPYRVGEHRDPEEPGEPREQGAGCDGCAGADEPLTIGVGAGAHEARARRRTRRVRKKC